MHRYSPPAHGGRSHRLLACQLLLLSLCFLHSVHALVPLAVQDEDDLHTDNWIDPETPKEFYKFKVPQGPYDIFTGNPMEYDLIFSDEFNDSKRTFEAGFDPKWTAVDIRDKTNMGQHYFLPSAVQVDKGNLIITTSKPKEKYRGAHYVSGSVQTWNKFCYTGGFVEVKAILPGKWGIPGTWPAIWIMGNLGRAAFTDSQDGKWPWSFDYCAPYIEKQQKKKQQISACGNLTDKHDPNSYPVNYGLNPYQGRGSTEIDVMEGQIRARDKPAFISTSLQITPSLTDDLRPASETLPGPGQWYQGLKYGNFTRINSDYYGENGLDAISALTQLESNAFTAYHLYQLDWQPGPDGHIRWWLDYNFLFEIPGSALNVWSNNVPPRMIPVEPSYLILSTAVSEKFSPPCHGQICDSIWPSNFTIDYVRVYQGNPNNYTSIGCDPEAFPTQTWVYTHPVDYGLPWYVSLQLGPALTHLFAFLNLVIGAAIAFGGVNHAKSATFYTSSLLLVAGFYGAFNFVSADDLAWIQVFIACMSGIVIAGICALFPTYALGALLGLFASLLIGQFLPLVLARCLVAVLVTCGLCAPLCNIEKKHVVIFATSGLGALAIMTSLSYWFDSGDVAANVWELSGLFLGGVEPKSQHVCTGDECLLLYALFIGVAILGVVFQFYSTHGKTVFEVRSAKAKSTSISAGSDARAWCHQDESAHNDKSNYFSPDALPAHLRPFGNVIKTATNVQRTFGFQTTNLRNQAEHIIVLLANNSRKGANAYRALHAQVFGNYQNWCMKLRVEPLCWNESRPSRSGLSEVDEIAVDLCLFFFIWGEASNLRHVPESLCFLFHKMKQEYPGVRQTTREEGHFLDTVITPIYGLMKSQMGGNADHIDRRTYDDFNEFFWDASCLEYDYKYEAVNEIAASPNPAFFQKHRSGFFQTTSQSNGPKSVAEKLSESCDKSFLEKRTWLASLRAFFRLFEFHVVSFHFLVALAFANKQEMDLEDALQVISSTLITPFVLHGLRGGLDIFSIYDARMATSDLVRHALLLLSHLCLTVISIALYWQALNFGGAWWATYYSTMLFLHLPGLFNSVLQIMPQCMNWLRRTHWGPVAYARDLLSPMNRLYVGDNVLDTASQSFGYYVFWITLLTWKLFFSYKFEIAPVVVPTFLLYADHVENNVGMLPTAFLIFLNWMPFFLVYCVDMTIWNSIWLAFTGTFVGFSSRIGEIRNFTRVRAAFARAADVFNAKLISIQSKTGRELHKSSRHDSYGSVSSIRGHEVLDQVTGDPATSSMKRTNGKSDQTPLLSFSRRKQTADEILQARRQKWISFSVAWDVVIDTMRADDLISNKEKSLLHFQRLDGYQREIYLPQFQLAGCFESFCNAVENVYSREKDVTERTLQDALLEILGENVMFEEAVEEVWELARWVLINVLGPCHSNDVQFICSTLNSWASRGAFRALNLRKIGPFALALADLLSSLSSNLGGWKKNAKYIPVRKNPSDYSNYQFPQQQGLRGASSSGLTKSASTTGLSSLGGTVPRRSRGAGIGRIAAMQQGNSKPKDSKSKSGGSHVIPGTHLVQIRDKLRTFLNLGKTMLTRLDDIDNLQAESRGLADRLTWILTQERGFFWDDEYAGEQLTLTAFEKHADVVVQHLHGLLTLQKVDAEPRSYDARRRLLFFVNSIFMDMPLAPLLEEMKSWSVMTPFYAEDVLYSKTDLESKRDGLDVHTLLFLQTVYQQDWENFIERVKPKKNLWKNPDTAAELRLWASLRGQTLARTVQGMMYGEAAIRLLAEIEQVPTEKIEELVRTKFTYVVACQVYGRQKRNNDPRAQDIEYLLHRFPNLRVAYIDEVRVNYQKEQSYFAVLIKGSETQGQVEEVYRIRLPGNPILGEGKPENQNAAIVFTRGEHLQTIDMNQDGYIEESLKMRNLLEEFDSGSADRPTTIVGLPEHIFTGSVSSLANYMALQETSFVTLGQRTLTNPLRVRMHYGHPDVFNKLFFITRGGISKASKGINLSEDIFAGYNNCLRGGTVAFPEYVKAGKGRDVGMQQIYKFEAKLAQGAAEQSLSRDVYRIAQRLDFFKLLSFYYNHVGFYLTTSLIIWTVYILLYCNIFRALMALEGVGGREPVLLSNLQVMLGCVAFFTTAPLMATISVERGFKAALKEVFMIVVTGGPFYFLFHIGTKWFYYGQTILAGGAKYRATGRGFVTKHSRFDELYRFYASSHLYSAVEIAFGLSVYWLFTIGHQYFAMTWSLWLVAFSWYFSPFWFNPLAFEWADVTDDLRVWLKWMRGTGGNPEQSWEAWFREENAYFSKLRTWAKLCIAAKGVLYMCLALAILAANDSYHSLLHKKTWLPFALTFGIALVYVTISSLFFNTRQGETGLVRFLKSIWIVVCAGGIITLFMYVDGMFRCMLSMIYLAAAIASWSLLVFGATSRSVSSFYYVHDVLLGGVSFGFILLLSALYVPGKIQTWLLYNNALSRGVVIEDILRTNQGRDDQDDMSLHQMRDIIVEQQRVISALTLANGSDSGEEKNGQYHDSSAITHTLSDNALKAMRNVSETELTALQDASNRLSVIIQDEHRHSEEQAAQRDLNNRARRGYSNNDLLKLANDSLNDATSNNFTGGH